MTKENPEIVAYSTFVRDLTESKISDVQIYDYGKEVDITYKTSDGALRAARSPTGSDSDELLSYTLKSKEVPFTIHAEEYSSGGSSFEWVNLISFSFFLVPLLMLIVILRQSKTIRDMAESLVGMTKLQKAEVAADRPSLDPLSVEPPAV